MAWGPAIDGATTGLLDVPYNLIQKGSFNKVPFMLGTNANEGSSECENYCNCTISLHNIVSLCKICSFYSNDAGNSQGAKDPAFQ